MVLLVFRSPKIEVFDIVNTTSLVLEGPCRPYVLMPKTIPILFFFSFLRGRGGRLTLSNPMKCLAIVYIKTILELFESIKAMWMLAHSLRQLVNPTRNSQRRKYIHCLYKARSIYNSDLFMDLLKLFGNLKLLFPL